MVNPWFFQSIMKTIYKLLHFNFHKSFTFIINFAEKEIIQHYFHKGFSYDVILDFLSKHGISISLRTLKRRLKEYGLKKINNHVVDEEAVRQLVKSEMSHAGEQSGYRTIWHALRLFHNIHPPRAMVAKMLRELDPEASNARRSRKLKRRNYLSPGPNYCCHVDGEFRTS